MATNFIQPGEVITLTWSGTSPTTGDPVIKCAAKATGGIIGVALNGVASASESISVATEGCFDVSVVASAAVAVGDFIYADVGGINVSTAVLGVDNSGLIFGQALQAMGATTATIKVRLIQPSHL